ncbi:MAG: hypothetical protein ACI80V_000809 [Rhodothermales bacterium]|jgi:hypothetical protein
MIQMRFSISLFLISAVLLSVAGCVSTEDRLNRATEAKERGDFLAAADDFIRVLDRETDNATARSGLENTGRQAVDDLWAQAHRDDSEERYMSALSQLSSLESLLSRASNVGVTLPSPGDISGFQSDVQVSAIDQSVAQARALISNGQPDRAATEMASLRSRFELGSRQGEVVRVQAEAELESARDLIDAGQPRAAWDRAGSAIATLGTVGSPVKAAAQALRAEALRDGTVRVAIVPFWRTQAFSEMASELLRSDLNYAIENSEEPPVPIWLDLVDSNELERVVRRDGADRRILLRQELRNIGRTLGAQVVVAGELVRLDQAEEIVSEVRVPIRTTGRAAVDTAFFQQDMRMAIGLRAAYRIIDVETGQIMEEGEIPAAGVSEFRRGVYSGDWRTLDLSGNQLRLFNVESVFEGIVEAERGLARTLAGQIREKAFAAAMARVR